MFSIGSSPKRNVYDHDGYFHRIDDNMEINITILMIIKNKHCIQCLRDNVVGGIQLSVNIKNRHVSSTIIQTWKPYIFLQILLFYYCIFPLPIPPPMSSHAKMIIVIIKRRSKAGTYSIPSTNCMETSTGNYRFCVH